MKLLALSLAGLAVAPDAPAWVSKVASVVAYKLKPGPAGMKKGNEEDNKKAWEELMAQAASTPHKHNVLGLCTSGLTCAGFGSKFHTVKCVQLVEDVKACVCMHGGTKETTSTYKGWVKKGKSALASMLPWVRSPEGDIRRYVKVENVYVKAAGSALPLYTCENEAKVSQLRRSASLWRTRLLLHLNIAKRYLLLRSPHPHN